MSDSFKKIAVLLTLAAFAVVVVAIVTSRSRSTPEREVASEVAPVPAPADQPAPQPLNQTPPAPEVVAPTAKVSPPAPAAKAEIVPVPPFKTTIPQLPPVIPPIAPAPAAPVVAAEPKPAPTEAAPAAWLNVRYAEDIVSVEGLAWRMQSSHQYYQGQERPSSFGFGLRGLHWVDNVGYEGLLRSDLFGLNRSGGHSEITNVELRAHRRTFVTSPFSSNRKMQLSVLGGVERFRNAESDIYSRGYDLIKIGATAAVPFGDHWALNLEGGLGFDFHLSRKFELQYMVQYFWSRTWSFGAGYRINLFEARTASQAPGGFFPYREGYTELRSAIYYHF